MKKILIKTFLIFMCCVVFVGIVYISPSIAVSSPFNMGGNTLGNQNIGALSYSWEFNSTGSFVGSSPVVALGHVYVANTNGQVVALDPSGLNDCSFNSMDICTPQFTFATPPNQPVYATPVVSGNLLLISVADIVYAFDATGSQNCSGTTIICTPLWSTEPMGGINMSTPVIFGSNFIVHDSIGLYSFSTTGVNCTSSSSSLVCNPLWSAPYGNQSYMPPAIYNTTVFSTSGGKLLAFDANGVVNCRGIPDVCNPEWTAQSAEDQLGVAVDSSTGEVFTASNYVYGFDANGITNCSNGTCSPIWQGAVAGSFILQSKYLTIFCILKVQMSFIHIM
jgi:outer membrane protein assembly factor BamB